MSKAENRFSFLRGQSARTDTCNTRTDAHKESVIEEQIASLLKRYGTEGLQLFQLARHAGFSRRRILAILTAGGAMLLSGCMQALQNGNDASRISDNRWATAQPNIPTAIVPPDAAYSQLAPSPSPQANSQPLGATMVSNPEQPALQPPQAPGTANLPAEWENGLPPSGREMNIGGPDSMDILNSTSYKEVFGKGDVSYNERTLTSRLNGANGKVRYLMAHLNPNVKFSVLTANKKTPTTIWTPANPEEAGWVDAAEGNYQWQNKMAEDNLDRLSHQGYVFGGSMNGGYHNAFSAIEGDVVHEGQVLHNNPNRATIKFVSDLFNAYIGQYDRDTGGFADTVTALGGGPIILAPGRGGRPKRVEPSEHEETDQFLPWNPFGENFINTKERADQGKPHEYIEQYHSNYPNSFVALGKRADGRNFVLMVVGDEYTVQSQILDMFLETNQYDQNGNLLSGVHTALKLDGGKSVGMQRQGHIGEYGTFGAQFISSALAVYYKP